MEEKINVTHKDDPAYQLKVKNLENAEKEFKEAEAKFESAKREFEIAKTKLKVHQNVVKGVVSIRRCKLKLPEGYVDEYPVDKELKEIEMEEYRKAGVKIIEKEA